MQYFKGISRLALVAALGGFSFAALPAVAAPVIPPGQTDTPQQVQQFLSNPSALLSQYPNGGPQLADAVYKLAGTDPAALPALTALLQTANPQEAAAIGEGLGKVADQAVKTDQAYATQIQQAIVGSHNSPALVAFDAAIGGNIQLTAAGAGGGGGGGGESPTGTNSGSGGFFAGSPFNGNNGVGNTADSFTFGDFNPSSTTGGNNTNTNTTTNVSSTTINETPIIF
jgi:hypothetical protein